METASREGADDYILGRTEREYERLRLQSRAWEEPTLRVLQKAGVGRGMSCLDAGCGPGEVMRLLGGTVGPSGQVTGLDVDRALGEYALDEIIREEGAHFSFHHGDIMSLESIPGGPFDFVFSRLVLCHTTDPVELLRRLWTWTKPGGVMAVMDYDMTVAGAVPPVRAVDRAIEITVATFAASGKLPDCGSRLPWLFEEAGIGPPAGTDIGGRLDPIAQVGPEVRGVLQSLSQPAVAMKLTTEAEVDELVKSIAEAEARPGLYGRLPLMIGAWARKPPL